MSTETQVSKKDKAPLMERMKEKINDLGNEGLKFPKNYSVDNAIAGAQLILSETLDKNGVSVLESCSNASIANAIIKMVNSGLNPQKNQCYFIPYGKKLELQISYQGKVAIAKRNGLHNIFAQAVYKGDEFEYSIDNLGRTIVNKHNQSLESKNGQIAGAYATCLMEDGSYFSEIMTMSEIQDSWNQGKAKGGSPAHKNFAAEMCKKTVTNRALKGIVSSSDDSSLYDDPELDKASEDLKAEVEENANKEVLEIESSSYGEHDKNISKAPEQPKNEPQQPENQPAGTLSFPENPGY